MRFIKKTIDFQKKALVSSFFPVDVDSFDDSSPVDGQASATAISSSKFHIYGTFG